MQWTRTPSPLDRAGVPSVQPSGNQQPIAQRISKEKSLRTLSEHSGSVYTSCFWASAEKGNMLISGGMDATVRVWALDKDHVLHTMKDHTQPVRCLAVSKNDHTNPMVLSGGDDGKLNIWSLSGGKLLHTLKGHKRGILALAMCLDDVYPFVASGGHDKAVRLWNYNSGEFMFMLQGHELAIAGLAITASSPPLLVSAGADKTMRVWELATGRLARKMEGHLGRVTCVAMSKDPTSNPILVSGDSTGAVIVWDLKKYKRLFNLIESSETAFSSSVENSEKGAYCEGTHSESTGEIASVGLSSSAENMLIVTSTWGAYVKIWDAKSGGLLRVFDDKLYGGMNRVLVCYDAVSALVAISSVDGTIYLVSPEDDYDNACRSITSLREMSIEASLVLVGKYVTYVRLLDDVAEQNADIVSKRLSGSNKVILTIVFYCMIRFAVVNPSFFLANVDITSNILEKIIDLVDLLFVDNFVGVTAMQFLLERRVCISVAQEWIRIEKNQARVMAFLGDKLQSNDTLDCVLSALVTDNLEGWNLLISHSNFNAIFENLMLHSPRSHSKLAYLISKYGLYCESEPFHIPLALPADKEITATRMGKIEYNSSGVHCYRVRVQDRLQTEFYMTHKFLEALISSDNVEELVAAPLVEYVLQYRWDSWGYNATIGLGVLHVFYCVSAMSALFCICSERYDTCRIEPMHAISVSVVVLINTLYMGLLALQYKMSPGFWTFWTSFWSVTEVLMIGLCHVCILLGTALGPVFVIRQVSAIFALILWAWLPYFGRGSFGLASLLHQMKIIIWEVRYFVGILLLFNCAFAVAFRILDIYDNIWHASIRCFNMMLGDVHFDFVFGHTFAEVLYLTFLISVGIILLNSLIAFMEGSLGSARRKERLASIISRAQFLAELEVRLLPFNRLAACFSASSDETLQEHLSPSAVLVKEDTRGGHKSSRKGVRAGTHNELVILCPESFGVPPFPTVDGSCLADENAPAALKSSIVPAEVDMRIENKFGTGEYGSRLEQVELQVSNLDKKLDLILNLLVKNSPLLDSRNNRDAATSRDDALTPGADVQQRFAAHNVLPGGDRAFDTPPQPIASANVGESLATPLSMNSMDEPVSYSYFGSADRDDVTDI